MLIEMGLRASLVGWGDFLRLDDGEDPAGLWRPETDGETIVGTRIAFWEAVRACVCVEGGGGGKSVCECASM